MNRVIVAALAAAGLGLAAPGLAGAAVPQAGAVSVGHATTGLDRQVAQAAPQKEGTTTEQEDHSMDQGAAVQEKPGDDGKK